MRRMRLLTTILALIAIGSAFANESDDAEAEPAPTLGVTLSCGVSGGLPTLSRGACTVSKRVITLANFEASLAVDGQVSFDPNHTGYLGGYLDLTYYGEDWSVFVELSLPSLVPPYGTGDVWRTGFTARF